MNNVQTHSTLPSRRQVYRRRLALMMVAMTAASTALAAAAGWTSSRGIAEGGLLVLLSCVAFLVGGLAGGLTAFRDNLPPGRRLDHSRRLVPSRRAANVAGSAMLRPFAHWDGSTIDGSRM